MSVWAAGVWADGVWADGVWFGMGGEAPAPPAIAATSGSSGQYPSWLRQAGETFTAYTPPPVRKAKKNKRKRILEMLFN